MGQGYQWQSQEHMRIFSMVCLVYGWVESMFKIVAVDESGCTKYGGP